MKKNNLKLIKIGLIIGFGFLLYSFINEPESNKNKDKSIENLKTSEFQMNLKIKDGIWVNSEDSLSIVKIKDLKWHFLYDKESIDSNNTYDYQIIEGVKNDKGELIDGNLLLTQQSDSLEYKIDYINDKNMTLVYLARGNFHHYNRKE